MPDTKAPKVISMVGTMLNLVNEVLQSAVGNHFRNTLQDQLEAVTFIETRMQVQAAALERDHASTSARTRSRRRASTSRTSCSPHELVEVLTQREIANQEKATFEEQQRAADVAHRDGEGEGHRRHAGASSRSRRWASRSSRTRPQAREARGAGRGGVRGADRSRPRRPRVEAIGLAEAKATEALGLARADGLRGAEGSARRDATALVAVANAVAEGHITVVPEVLVTGGGGGSSRGSRPRSCATSAPAQKKKSPHPTGGANRTSRRKGGDPNGEGTVFGAEGEEPTYHGRSGDR